jgi:hypothetical protein
MAGKKKDKKKGFKDFKMKKDAKKGSKKKGD